MKTQVSAQAKKLFASLALAAIVAPVWAATQTVTLSVPGMTSVQKLTKATTDAGYPSSVKQ